MGGCAPGAPGAIELAIRQEQKELAGGHGLGIEGRERRLELRPALGTDVACDDVLAISQLDRLRERVRCDSLETWHGRHASQRGRITRLCVFQ
jgi:hypothetical protein